MLIFIYLAAIVASNLIVAHFGPASVLIVGFIFVGFDITARDVLHEKWKDNGALWRNMFLLIGAGAAISYLINAGSEMVSIASFVAFAASETVDTIMYQIFHKWPRGERITVANGISALVDSVLFPTIAFGAFIPGIVTGQFLVKTLGGVLWMAILFRARRK